MGASSNSSPSRAGGNHGSPVQVQHQRVGAVKRGRQRVMKRQVLLLSLYCTVLSHLSNLSPHLTPSRQRRGSYTFGGKEKDFVNILFEEVIPLVPYTSRELIARTMAILNDANADTITSRMEDRTMAKAHLFSAIALGSLIARSTDAGDYVREAHTYVASCFDSPTVMATSTLCMLCTCFHWMGEFRRRFLYANMAFHLFKSLSNFSNDMFVCCSFIQGTATLKVQPMRVNPSSSSSLLGSSRLLDILRHVCQYIQVAMYDDSDCSIERDAATLLHTLDEADMLTVSSHTALRLTELWKCGFRAVILGQSLDFSNHSICNHCIHSLAVIFHPLKPCRSDRSDGKCSVTCGTRATVREHH